MMEVETATLSEKQEIKRKEDVTLTGIQSQTLRGDDAYTKAMRIRNWAKRGMILITPALRWRNDIYAKSYRNFIKTQIDIAHILKKRRTAIELLFDLITYLLDTKSKQKSFFRQGIRNVPTHT